jgi:hypothetical protein
MDPDSGPGCPLWISPEAIAAGKQVAELAGVSLEALVEFMLFDVRAHAAAAGELPRPRPAGDRNVVPISRARPHRGLRRRPAGTGEPDAQDWHPA